MIWIDIRCNGYKSFETHYRNIHASTPAKKQDTQFLLLLYSMQDWFLMWSFCVCLITTDGCHASFFSTGSIEFAPIYGCRFCLYHFRAIICETLLPYFIFTRKKKLFALNVVYGQKSPIDHIAFEKIAMHFSRWGLPREIILLLKQFHFWFSRGNSFCHNPHAIP